MSKSDKKYISAGAVWSNKSKSGKTFYNGHIEITIGRETHKVFVVGFPKKKGDPQNWPALRLYVDESRDPKTGKRLDGRDGNRSGKGNQDEPIGAGDDKEEEFV